MKKTISLVLVLALGMAAKVANADFIFGTPTNLGPTVNSSADEWDPSISADGLSFYFGSDRYGGGELWVTTRATVSDPWGTPVNLGPTVNSSAGDWGPSISTNALSLYFISNRSGGQGGWDLWVTTRETTDDPWGAPVNLGPTVNSSGRDAGPSISADELELFFESRGRDNVDIWVTTRATVSDPWGSPVDLGPTVNSAYWDGGPSISADGRTLLFDSDRPGGYGNYDLWVTTRATTDDPWGTPVNLGPTVNSAYLDDTLSISADGSTLYFTSTRPGGVGGGDLWQVSIIPVVDLNSDGIVDSADMCIIVDNWGTDEPLCDIGPTPFGDGIVDVQDLIVLAEHLFEEPRLIAYWKLDDTEGIVAQDSAGANDAYVFGGPLWQSTGGMVDGALRLDGIDDYVVTSFILDPADGPFSVFAWIKGGALGQVIVSQTNGTGIGRSWLCTDPSDGKLMTRLTSPPGRTAAPPPLLSEFVVTDGDWHHLGFVWDASYRHLYVDGTEVAKDTKSLTTLESADGGLYIGAGNTPDAGTFFTGLIDDVRIYNQTLSAEEIAALAQ